MSEYRKSKPEIDVFLNGHRFTLPMIDANIVGGKVKASATYAADVWIDNRTKKISITASANGGFQKYVAGHKRGTRPQYEINGHVGAVEVRVNFPDSPTVKGVWLQTVREGEKSSYPRYDADALMLGADYDMAVNFHAVVSPAKSTVKSDKNTGGTVTDLAADNARMAAKAAEMEAELVADLRK